MSETRKPQVFNPRLVAGLIAGGIVAFAAFVLLSAYAQDFRSGRDGRGHALSVSAVGFKGIVTLVGLVGGNARLVRSGRNLDTEDLVVVTVEPGMTTEQIETLLDTRGPKTTLIVLPKWVVVPDPKHPGWVIKFGDPDASLAKPIIPKAEIGVEAIGRGRVAIGTGVLNGLLVPAPARSQTVKGSGLRPILAVPGHGALIAQYGDSARYLLADPDLMNNQGLKDPRTARAALQILASLNATDAESVRFDVTLNGFEKSPSLLKLPFEPPFLALTVTLFVAALLAGLHGAFRFGPEARDTRAIAFGKMALVDNSAGLIQLAQREHRTGAAYAELVREAAAQVAGAPAALRGAELDAYLDRLSPADSAKFSALAERLQRASDRHELVSAARALFLWKKEFVR